MYNNLHYHAGKNSSIEHLLVNAENRKFLLHENAQHELIQPRTVDTCYIDPPYNTGNSGFTYADKKDTPAWLEFMEERLIPVRSLMKETGVILVSIDDSEVHNLRLLMDNIFGRKNFIAQLVIDGGNPKNNARFFSISHEYMLVYAQNLSALQESGIKWRKRREGIDALLKQHVKLLKTHKEDYETVTRILKTWMKTANLSPRLSKFYNVDQRGLYTYADLSAPGKGAHYVVLHPLTGKPCQVPSRGWGYTQDSMKKLLDDDMIIFGKDESSQPMKKLYLQDRKDQVQKGILAYPSRTTTHALVSLLGRRSSFTHPKNLNMMMDIIDLVTPSDGVVLDYFAGSGTTGHAVMELNKKSLHSQRTSILVTNNENNIFEEVTYPRLYKVWEGWNDTKSAQHVDGLRVLSLDGTTPIQQVHYEGENAENCPGCKDSQPPYPWICPGDNRYKN